VFRTTVYELVVGCVGLLTIILYVPHLHRHNWALATLMVGFATIVEAIPVPVGKVVGSLMIAIPIGVMVVYGDAEAVLLSAIAMMLAPLLQRRQTKFSTWLFNVGQNGLSMCAMVEVYRLTHVANPASLLNWNVALSVVLGVAAYIVVNHAFIHVLQWFRGVFDRSDIVNLLVADGLNNLIALLPAFLMMMVSHDSPILGPVVILPIVLLGQVIRLYRETAKLHAIQSEMARLTSEFDVQKLCEVAADIGAKLSYAECVVVFTFDEERQVLLPTAVYPKEAAVNFDPNGYRERDGGIIWSVIRENRSLYVPDTSKDSRARYDGYGVKYQSMAIFPMLTRGMVQGAIVCYSERPYAFPDLGEYLKTLAAQLAVLLENAKLYKQLKEQSSRDGATGLYNYRYFYEELERRVQLARERGTPVSAAVIDVDYFKKFNDTYGHLAGDAVLKSVGQLLVSLAGPEAFVARYGGEEFGIIFPYTKEETYERVEHLRNEVSRHVVEFEGYRLQGITISSGVASFPTDATNDRDLLLKADSAMYWGAKQRGRNRTAVYSPEFDAQLFIDELTGLYTHHFLNIRLREEIYSGVCNWGAICLDLDNFSYINSTFGFEVGDKVLKETSLLIRESLRQNELACRFGGDEFLILLPNVGEPELSTIAKRVVNAIANHRFRGGPSLILSVRSNVVVEYVEEIRDATDLLDRVAQRIAGMQTSLQGESLA
jgi:diguanylate cyclase (GGDEF)-like protein